MQMQPRGWGKRRAARGSRDSPRHRTGTGTGTGTGRRRRGRTGAGPAPLQRRDPAAVPVGTYRGAAAGGQVRGPGGEGGSRASRDADSPRTPVGKSVPGGTGVEGTAGCRVGCVGG